jgi:hypothetical protein
MFKKGKDAMKRTAIGIVAFGCVIVLGAFSATAQAPSHMDFTVDGTTNFLSTPVLFDGTVTDGEPMLNGGYWSILVDDTGWPGVGDPQTRWNYIAATYYNPNYDPMLGTWTAVFDSSTTNSSPWWETGKSGVGKLTGVATLQMTIQDYNFDGVIDPDERGFIIFSGTLIVVKNGEGIFAGYCGLGSYSGSQYNPDPYNWADDIFSGRTILDIEDCSVPVQEVSWGHIKAQYR